jgi:hypothetical protein
MKEEARNGRKKDRETWNSGKNYLFSFDPTRTA